MRKRSLLSEQPPYFKMDKKDIEGKWTGHSGLEQDILVEFC